MNIEQINKHLNEINEILDKLHQINNKKMLNNIYHKDSYILNIKESDRQKDFMSNPTITINDKYISHDQNDDKIYFSSSLMDLDEKYSRALQKIMKS